MHAILSRLIGCYAYSAICKRITILNSRAPLLTIVGRAPARSLWYGIYQESDPLSCFSNHSNFPFSLFRSRVQLGPRVQLISKRTYPHGHARTRTHCADSAASLPSQLLMESRSWTARWRTCRAPSGTGVV